ncbi:MAG: hypothetical protein ACOCYT_05110, partial [Chloroflexota bacterium]
MKGYRISTLLALCLVIAGVITAAATLVSAQSDDNDATPTPAFSRITVPDAFLRAGPGLEYLTVGSLQRGARLTPLNINAEAQWVMVRFRGGFAWIRRDLATWVEDIDALPVLPETDLTPTLRPGEATATPDLVTPTPVGSFVRESRANALVRVGPGQSFLRLGAL